MELHYFRGFKSIRRNSLPFDEVSLVEAWGFWAEENM